MELYDNHFRCIEVNPGCYKLHLEYIFTTFLTYKLPCEYFSKILFGSLQGTGETEKRAKTAKKHQYVKIYLKLLSLVNCIKTWALFQFPPFKFIFENLIYRCHNAMKIGMVNKSTIMNRFVLHTLQRNITHIAVITRKTNINIDILKGGGKVEKSQNVTA